MNVKDKLKTTIQSYITVEEEIKTLQKELKNRRALRKEYTEILINIMKTNEIDCFDISEGKILYTQNKTRTPLSKKYLIECLDKYFEKYPNIQSEDVTNFVLDNRKEQVKENIRHKPNKNS